MRLISSIVYQFTIDKHILWCIELGPANAFSIIDMS